MNAFLHAGRLRAWCIILAGAMGLRTLLAVAQAALGFGEGASGLAPDFTCFRAAGVLAAKGMAASVYQPAVMAAAENAQRVLPHGQFFPFFYPPSYLVLLLPLAWVPYWPALLLFLAVGFLPLVLALRRLEPAGFGWLPILAFPGMLLNAGSGQNGFLTAACFAGFMLLADARPVLAGACLGLLACKPHLAVLAPLALLAAGRWRSLAGAAAAFAVLAGLSLALFGPGEWLAFLAASHDATRTITGDMTDQSKIQSAFIAVRLLGGNMVLAAAVQAAVAVAACSTMLWFVRRRPGGAAEGAALAAAALLCTPYLADYDLVCLAPPLAYAAARAARPTVAGSSARYDRLLLIAIYLLPLVARGIALRTGVQVAPLAIAALLMLVVRPDPRGVLR